MTLQNDNFTPELRRQIVEHLSEFVLKKRLEHFQSVLENRTRYITVVLEDIFQSQNASAVIRSCECFGVHDVHIVENANKFSVNPKVSLGSSKWLNIIRHNLLENNSVEAIDHLKAEGYRIVATSPHFHHTMLGDLDLTKGKLALFFGSELNGLSSKVIENADELLKINTVGFTESLNLSVSAAICIHNLTSKLHKSDITYGLSNEEKVVILHQWLRLSVKSWKSIEKRFLADCQQYR
jgi:tRNA (guanosine-2'-O-)-methyltransferase